MNKKCRFKTTDRFSISGVHTVSGSKGVALWLHGITVNKDEYLNFFKYGAEALSAAGFDSLRIDFRGHGNSSGTPQDFSITGQMLDVEAALSYISKYYKKNTPLIIVGCSFGAPPALFAAERNIFGLKSIVMIAPVLSYIQTFLQPQTDWAKSIFNKQAFSALARTNRLYINPKFPASSNLIEEMKIIRPEITLKSLRQKMVIIHGDKDSIVPFGISEELAKTNPNINFFPFVGMDHGFMDADDEQGTSTQSQKNKTGIYKIIQDQFK